MNTQSAERATSKPKSAKKYQADDSAPWLDACIVDDRGRPLPNLANAACALRSAPELVDAFTFDELERCAIVNSDLPRAPGAEARPTSRPPRPLSDADVSQLQEWMQHAGLAKITRETMHQAVTLRAVERPFHPIRDYLGGLRWDGRRRLGHWLTTTWAQSPTHTPRQSVACS